MTASITEPDFENMCHTQRKSKKKNTLISWKNWEAATTSEITEEQSGLPQDQKGFSGLPGKKGMDTDSSDDSDKQATDQSIFYKRGLCRPQDGCGRIPAGYSCHPCN